MLPAGICEVRRLGARDRRRHLAIAFSCFTVTADALRIVSLLAGGNRIRCGFYWVREFGGVGMCVSAGVVLTGRVILCRMILWRVILCRVILCRNGDGPGRERKDSEEHDEL